RCGAGRRRRPSPATRSGPPSGRRCSRAWSWGPATCRACWSRRTGSSAASGCRNWALGRCPETGSGNPAAALALFLGGRLSLMSQNGSSSPGSADDSVWLEQRVEEFETAWQRGERPALESYLASAGDRRRPLLIELVHADLELRLKAGEPA